MARHGALPGVTTSDAPEPSDKAELQWQDNSIRFVVYRLCPVLPPLIGTGDDSDQPAATVELLSRKDTRQGSKEEEAW